MVGLVRLDDVEAVVLHRRGAEHHRPAILHRDAEAGRIAVAAAGFRVALDLIEAVDSVEGVVFLLLRLKEAAHSHVERPTAWRRYTKFLGDLIPVGEGVIILRRVDQGRALQRGA